MTVTTQPGEQLLYSFVTTERTLATEQQTPVWPVRHESDLTVLRTIARSFGGTITPCKNVKRRRLSGAGVVIALGQDVAGEAELYAHLTLRECVVVSGLKDISRLPGSDVVIATEDKIDESLLEMLYEDGTQASATGLIYAPTLAQLRQQVLLRSAAAYLCRRGLDSPSPPVQRIDFLSTTELGHAVLQDWQLLGTKATIEEATQALSVGAGVLSLVSHSDGVDSPLSSEAVLCAIQDARADAPLAGAPACVVTGVCHRRREPIAVALASGGLVFPSVIQARIMVADVCWGLLPPLDVIHPAWGLGRRLLENHSIGAFITCWEIMRSSVQLIAPLVDAIADGTPVGESLAEQQASARWKKFGRRMCLIGDPRVCIPRPSEPVSLSNLLPTTGPEVRSLKTGALEFLRAYITLARKNVGGTYEDYSDSVLAALGEYQEALWTGAELEGAPEAPGPRLRQAFMNFAFGRFSVAYPIWQQFADDWAVLAPQRCYACQRIAVTLKFYLCIPGASARRVTNCQSCGTIEDVPVGTHLTFSVSPDGEVKLNGELPSGHCVGGLMLETSMPDERRVFPWPGDSRGNLAPTFRVSPPWPEGPIRVSVFIISESCELISLGLQCRGERLVSVSG